MVGEGQDYVNMNTLPIKALKEPIEDCLATNGVECTYRKGMPILGALKGGYASQMAFFCGHHPECNVFESDALFNRAVEVIL